MRKANQMQKFLKWERLTGDAAAAFDQAVKRKYEGGKSIRAIVAESGRSYGAVYQALRRAGAQLRTRGGHHRRPRSARRAS